MKLTTTEEQRDLEQPELEDDYLDDAYSDDFLSDGELTPMARHNDLLKELTNFAPYLKECFNNWLGITWNQEKGGYEKNRLIKPIMNLNGAAWCIGFLKTYTRSNNIITNIRLDEYKMMMNDLIEAIWLNLGTREDFGIKEDGDIIRIANELEHAAALALMGAGDGKYNKLLQTTISRHETINEPGFESRQIGLAGNKPGFVNKLRNFITG